MWLDTYVLDRIKFDWVHMCWMSLRSLVNKLILFGYSGLDKVSLFSPKWSNIQTFCSATQGWTILLCSALSSWTVIGHELKNPEKKIGMRSFGPNVLDSCVSHKTWKMNHVTVNALSIIKRDPYPYPVKTAFKILHPNDIQKVMTSTRRTNPHPFLNQTVDSPFINPCSVNPAQSRLIVGVKCCIRDWYADSKPCAQRCWGRRQLEGIGGVGWPDTKKIYGNNTGYYKKNHGIHE